MGCIVGKMILMQDDRINEFEPTSEMRTLKALYNNVFIFIVITDRFPRESQLSSWRFDSKVFSSLPVRQTTLISIKQQHSSIQSYRIIVTDTFERFIVVPAMTESMMKSMSPNTSPFFTLSFSLFCNDSSLRNFRKLQANAVRLIK